MNKQRKRCISPSKFNRVKHKGTKLKPFFCLNSNDDIVLRNPWYFNGFLYWVEYDGSIKRMRHYRKSIEEALK